MPVDALLWILVGLALGITMSMVVLVAYAALERRSIARRAKGPAAGQPRDDQSTALRRRAKAALSVPMGPELAEGSAAAGGAGGEPGHLVALTRALESGPPLSPTPVSDAEPELDLEAGLVAEPVSPEPDPVIILPPPRPTASPPPPPPQPVVIEVEANRIDPPPTEVPPAPTPEPPVDAKPPVMPTDAPAPAPAPVAVVPPPQKPVPARPAIRKAVEVTPPPAIKPPPMPMRPGAAPAPDAAPSPVVAQPPQAPVAIEPLPAPPEQPAAPPEPVPTPEPEPPADPVIGGVRFAPVPRRPVHPPKKEPGA